MSNIGNRIEIRPSRELQVVLRRWMVAQTSIYNAKVSEYKYFERFRNRTLSLAGYEMPIDSKYKQFQ